MQRNYASYEELTLVLAPETELVAIDPLVEEVRHDFLRITIRKQTFGIAAGGPGFEYLEIGLVVVIAAAAYEFLKAFVSEAGRDAYRGVKEALARTYRMLPVQTDRGKFHPIAFRLELKDPTRTLVYRFREQMMTGQIDKALELMVTDAEGRFQPSELVYDIESERWNPLAPL